MLGGSQGFTLLIKSEMMITMIVIIKYFDVNTKKLKMPHNYLSWYQLFKDLIVPSSN